MAEDLDVDQAVRVGDVDGMEDADKKDTNERSDDLDKKEDQITDDQTTDIDFTYSDSDEYTVEIAELYSYSEEQEFILNKQYFNEDFSNYASTKWFETSFNEQRMHVLRLLDRLESGKREIRRQAVRSLLYLLQGNFGDCELEEDQITWARKNVYLCIEAGVFPAITQLLLAEIEYDKWFSSSESIPENVENDAKKESSSGAVDCYTSTSKKSAVSLADSADLRAILSVLYIMVETVRDGMQTNVKPSGGVSNTVTQSLDRAASLREQFCEELGSPVVGDADTTLTVILLGMVHRFCGGLAPNFPMKKVLLLLWKVLLITLGPITTLFARKNAVRARWGLPPLSEDTYQVIRRVRANSPPGSSTDQLLARSSRANNRHTTLGQGNQAPRQGTLATGRANVQQPPRPPSVVTSVTYSFSAPQPQAVTPVPSLASSSSSEISGLSTPRPGSPVQGSTNNAAAQAFSGRDTPLPSLDSSGKPFTTFTARQGFSNFQLDAKALPWKPKVRKKDLEAFLSNVRMKFVGFQVPDDTTTLIGLPEPIHEAVRVMREHLYVSLGEVQVQRERELIRYPLSMGREQIPETAVERLYRAVYPLLPQYMIALLRVLLAAAPTSRNKTEPLNILAEVMMPEDPSWNVVRTAILNFDINRHRELIVKAISAILLLLLKHMKLNHIYQFEYVSQYLVYANCIPLILKFFNQNTCHYVHAKNTLSFLDFPSRLIGNPPELTPEMLMSDWSSYCWRNLFACINLLRVLNMLTKWKHSRTMLLVVFKSAPILKRALRVRHAMMQLYVLKLLKLQSRYFGRQWRKNNMSIMSAIYQKVRHRLTDDWAYGNDVDAMPWHYQVEEHTLRTEVDQFNQRRYTDNWLDPEFRPVDNSLTSVLNQPFRLSDEFERNYEKWLEEEVFSVPINWSQVLARH
ncbi:Striatin-interacting protein 1 [Clonorchis sinensis]|uniref:Striatin-interacting protein 1 n=2 Tax=Clonorchis sinensis TaxID=79923 RepID=A0A8T1MSG0_CLOSI|nr:Striatin-interacting protein 1 [Clonorchis sinensis]